MFFCELMAKGDFNIGGLAKVDKVIHIQSNVYGWMTVDECASVYAR